MPTVVVASSLARWLTAVPSAAGERALTVHGATARDVLDALFAVHPQLRGYVTDERGCLRHHVAVFIAGEPVRDKTHLSEPVPADAEVYVLQSLSGG